MAGLCADADRRRVEQHRGVPGRVQRDDDLLCADDGALVVLPEPDPVRRGRAGCLLCVLRYAGRCQARQDLRRLSPTGYLRRHDRSHHRGIHHSVGRWRPGADLPRLRRTAQERRSAGLPRGLVGLRPLLAADQRGGPYLHLVRRGGHRLRCQAHVRARQPWRLPAVHPVPAAGQRPPHPGRPRRQHRVEGGQHQLLHVLRRAGFHDPRPVDPGRHGSGATRTRLQQGFVRVAAQGTLEQPHVLRRVHRTRGLRLPGRHLPA